MGEREKVKNAVFEAIGVAKDVIDMNTHKGQHSRFGATDVCPFIPIKGMDMDDAVKIANELGEMVAKYQYFYMNALQLNQKEKT